MSRCIGLSTVSNSKIRQMKDNGTIIFGGVRSYGKSMQKQLMQNMKILKEWPSGTIATIGVNGTRYSELADAEEIKD